ncbi:hypothetical protein B0H14DRAFT_2845407 [Mycena olivaceomarginata]|nr:hypothetical protein B0H14DRAFT_2845407 [Mycena olivaceomarginata]
MQDVYNTLNQAKQILHKICSSAIIGCNMFIADQKITFQECLHSCWGTYNEVELFCLEDLPISELGQVRKWQFRWTVTYLGYAYKTKDNFALHKALLCLGDDISQRQFSMWQTPRPLFERSLQATDVTHIDLRLSAAEKCDQEALITLAAPNQWLNTGSGSEGVFSVLMPY